jgi:hypothetical protein
LVPAAVGDVGVGESEAEEVVDVVGQLQVVVHVPAADRTRTLRVGLQHHYLLGREHGFGTEDFSGPRGVHRRHEVRVGSGGAVARQLEHLRAKRGEDDRRGPSRWRRIVGVLRDRLHVGAHGGQRPVVLVAARLDRGGVADAEAEHEALVEASLSVFAPLAAAIASRAQMLAMPVATPIRSGAPSRMAACESASRFVGVSLNQTAP